MSLLALVLCIAFGAYLLFSGYMEIGWIFSILGTIIGFVWDMLVLFVNLIWNFVDILF